jgi:hypothetical protein
MGAAALDHLTTVHFDIDPIGVHLGISLECFQILR